ncbi:MAG: NADH-quinone oxidoreductase subunit L [Candidatus Promineifilaceae bacterium]|nr:NADH-quinone oxidoreductase subunit L [Candidatus Promineifilaceae bacterium]
MTEQTLTTLTWLIPAGPLLAFFLIMLFTNRSRTLSWLIAWAGVFLALGLAWTVAINAIAMDAHHLEEHPTIVNDAIEWLPVGDFFEGTWIELGVAVDPLTSVMLIMVTFTVTMIFIYSVGYHNWGAPLGRILGVPNHLQEEPLLSRFFAYMSLFAGGMLMLVVSGDLLLLFIGWEIMGFCSYSLIGFWYARDYHLEPGDIPHIPPRKAGIKAFLTTRIADVVMLLGIVFFYTVFGTLNFAEALSAESLAHAVMTVGAVALGIMSLLIFAGTVGKSAQWPLHVWLPDAMEGPTPVSAVIHAAAMVSAGVYLILRIFPLIAVGMGPEGAPVVGFIIGGIGAFTAFMAATIAVAQYDVKGVLAYSTISQLGFMVAAIGAGAYVAAAFHLITHGFFKALLFLASGSVIHGMEHGAHEVHDHHTDPQDMRFMGGLRKKMPATFWTFLIGGLALSGFPFLTAGFWSKDEIFADAWHQWSTDGKILALIVFIGLVVAAFLTAFYTMRQISLTFLGKPRSPLAEHAHESNKFMTVPLVLLSVFAVAVGWAGIPENLPILGPLVNNNFFHHFVGATVHETLHELYELHLVDVEIITLPFNPTPLIASLVVALGGLFVGWWIYGRKPLKEGQRDPLERPLGPLHGFLNNKWYWDELYQFLFIRPTVYLSERVVYEIVDKGIIDGIIHLVARAVFRFGQYVKRFEEKVISDGVDWLKDQFLSIAREFRFLQTGRVQEYALISTLIATALIAVILLINFGWLARLFP